MIVPIHRVKPGQTAQVVELKSGDAGRLDRLGAFGLVPGSWVVVQQIQPALILRVGETEISIDENVAREILVRVGKPKG